MSQEFRLAIKSKYGADDKKHEGLTKAIDKFQNHFQCCGYDNHKDWQASAYYTRTGVIPTSCCRTDKKKDPKCGQNDPAALSVIYQEKVKYPL